jgi:hypothetical protein
VADDYLTPEARGRRKNIDRLCGKPAGSCKDFKKREPGAARGVAVPPRSKCRFSWTRSCEGYALRRASSIPTIAAEFILSEPSSRPARRLPLRPAFA